MGKSEKKAESGEGKNGKKKWIIVGVVVVVLLAAAVGGNKGNDQAVGTGSEPSTQASTPAETEPPTVSEPSSESTGEVAEQISEPEANTYEKVTAIAKAAKDAVAEGVTEEKRDEAVAFLVEHYPYFYLDNETMETVMYYGYWLEYAYAGDETARDYEKLGTDTYQAVKYVYAGSESESDEATMTNLRQIKKSLEAIGQTVE